MMILYHIVVSTLFVIPMVFAYNHKVHLSKKSGITDCQRINDTFYRCNSVISMLKILSDIENSIDIFIQSGTYILNMSYTLEDLHNIRIRSNTSKPTIIKCDNNSNDTGVAFLRVRNLIINHLSIVGCGMKHNSTSYLGEGNFILVRIAILIQNSSDFSLNSVNISNSTGIGLLMYDTCGLVNITESIFANNKVGLLDSKAANGGIHIELASCGSHDNPHNRDSKYIIDQCTFEGNAAMYGYNIHSVEDIANNHHFITFGTGGGMSLWFNGQAKNNSFEIISSKFISNAATLGGGLHILSRQNATHNYVKILECSFIGNIGCDQGGGLTIGYIIHQNGGLSKFNTYNITNCLFEQNRAVIGGGVLGFGSREQENATTTNHFEINNSSFINNTAQFGSAIQINKEYYDSIRVGLIFILVIESCNFTNNSFHGISHTNSSSVGTVAMSGISIKFLGCTHFSNNTSTALMVDGATVEFGDDSLTVFQNNTGLHGGAISLIEGAKITVHPHSTLIFLSNTAVEHGGAIFVELSTPFDYLLSHVCFIRYHSEKILPSKWETNFTFINNTARQTNNSIFASTMRPCERAYPNETKLFDNKPFYHHPNGSNKTISTLPATFEFLNGTDTNFSVVPGEIYDMQVILKDEMNKKVDSAIFIATCIESQSPKVLLPYHFTDGTIQIAGKPNQTCNLQLQTDTAYPASTKVQVTLLNCPPGLVFNSYKRQCQCVVNHTHHSPAISNCDVTGLRAYYNNYYWIGYESDDATDMIFGLCPYYYCYNDYASMGQLLPRDANKTVLDKFVCNDRRRTGVLCGQCIEGYSVVMNSPTSTCHKCQHVHLGILYLILSYILPVSILFYIIMSYNIRMTTGLISAYLFISQIVGSHYYYSSLKANTDASITIFNIIIAIYSISNLEFFQHDIFSYCLFSNAGTIDILAFKLLLSFYPISLIFTYFLLRRCCICKHHCFNNFRFSSKSVTHGVSAFLVLCFAKINILTFAILKYSDLFYVNGTSYRRVVHLQGDIEYFGKPLYNVYAVGSLVTIIIIIIVPTIILVLHPILISIASYFEWGESKFILLINKLLLIHRLKPVLDTFQGDYKDKLHFFAGLHFLLYRVIFFSIIMVASTADVNQLYLLITTYFLIVLLIHVITMPFKRFINNAAYSLVYVIMTSLIIIEHYFFSTGTTTDELIWPEILLTLLPLVCILLYCSWKLFISAKLYWKKHRECSNDPSSLNDYHLLNFPERMVNDDTDTSDCSDDVDNL